MQNFKKKLFQIIAQPYINDHIHDFDQTFIQPDDYKTLLDKVRYLLLYGSGYDDRWGLDLYIFSRKLGYKDIQYFWVLLCLLRLEQQQSPSKIDRKTPIIFFRYNNGEPIHFLNVYTVSSTLNDTKEFYRVVIEFIKGIDKRDVVFNTIKKYLAIIFDGKPDLTTKNALIYEGQNVYPYFVHLFYIMYALLHINTLKMELKEPSGLERQLLVKNEFYI